MKPNLVGKEVHNFIDLTGQRFGKLFVLQKHISIKNRARWLCKCDCGITCIATGKTLREGKKKSCGCLFNAVFKRASENFVPAALFLMKRYEAEAKSRKLEFNINISEFIKLTSDKCNYCGTFPEQLIDNYAVPYKYNGIDRVDNNVGYLLKNCVSCCKYCNSSKGKRNVQEFINHCQRIINFQNSKKSAEMTDSSLKEVTKK